MATQRAVPNYVLCQFLPLLNGRPAGFSWRNTLSRELQIKVELISFICKIMLKNYVLTHAILHLKSIVSSKSVSVWRPDISKVYSQLHSVIYN
jgi:hypothetical protein